MREIREGSAEQWQHAQEVLFRNGSQPSSRTVRRAIVVYEYGAAALRQTFDPGRTDLGSDCRGKVPGDSAVDSSSNSIDFASYNTLKAYPASNGFVAALRARRPRHSRQPAELLVITEQQERTRPETIRCPHFPGRIRIYVGGGRTKPDEHARHECRKDFDNQPNIGLAHIAVSIDSDERRHCIEKLQDVRLLCRLPLDGINQWFDRICEVREQGIVEQSNQTVRVADDSLGSLGEQHRGGRLVQGVAVTARLDELTANSGSQRTCQTSWKVPLPMEARGADFPHSTLRIRSRRSI